MTSKVHSDKPNSNLYPLSVGARYSHEEVREIVGTDEDGGYDIDRGYVTGQQYLYRQVRLERIIDSDRRPFPTRGLVKAVLSGEDLGYDYADLMRAIRGRRALPPIVADEHGDLYMLRDGKHRLIALNALGRKTTHALVRLPLWRAE